MSKSGFCSSRLRRRAPRAGKRGDALDGADCSAELEDFLDDIEGEDGREEEEEAVVCGAHRAWPGDYILYGGARSHGLEWGLGDQQREGVDLAGRLTALVATTSQEGAGRY